MRLDAQLDNPMAFALPQYSNVFDRPNSNNTLRDQFIFRRGKEMGCSDWGQQMSLLRS
ncbi:MAG: hypothetical protein ACJAWC_001185 [Yoonia sp.]|jgi:hypothetical protein